jgi:hypothetical protein
VSISLIRELTRKWSRELLHLSISIDTSLRQKAEWPGAMIRKRLLSV